MRLRALGAIHRVRGRVASFAVQFLLGDLGEEAARVAMDHRPEAALRRGVRQHEPLLRARDAHVEQPAFLVEPSFLHAALVRQRAVLEADQVHEAELEALRAVQGHQAHGVARIVAVGVAEQRELRRELADAVRRLAHRRLQPRHELADVFHAPLEQRLVRRFRLQVLVVARFRDERVGQPGRAAIDRDAPQVLDELDESGDRVAGPRAELSDHARVRCRAQQAAVLATGDLAQLLERRRTHFALRRDDRAQERRVVVGVRDEAQVRDEVLHLGALEERRPAGHVVGDAQQAQRLLEGARLEVAAIEDRELVPLRLRLRLHVRDLGRDLLRFRLVVLALDDADRRTVRVLAPELLLEEVLVVRDHRVRGTQDARAAAVVLLELHDAQRGVVARELAQILGVGAAPRVDRLVVVADRGERAALAGERLQQAVLRVVRVLVFVDEEIADALAPRAAQLGVRFEQRHRQANKIVEVDRVERGEPTLVLRVQLGDLQLARRRRGRECLLGRRARVLQARDRVAADLQHVLLRRGRQQLLQQRGRIVGVEDREAAAQARTRVLEREEAQAERVERGDLRLELAVAAAQQLRRALAHLARRLVRERDRGDPVRAHPVLLHEVRDLLGDHLRLARTGAREHEQRPVDVGDGFALGGVEGHRVFNSLGAEE